MTQKPKDDLKEVCNNVTCPKCKFNFYLEKPKDDLKYAHFSSFKAKDEYDNKIRQQTAQDCYYLAQELKNRFQKGREHDTRYLSGLLFGLSELQKEIKQKYLGDK